MCSRLTSAPQRSFISVIAKRSISGSMVAMIRRLKSAALESPPVVKRVKLPIFTRGSPLLTKKSWRTNIIAPRTRRFFVSERARFPSPHPNDTARRKRISARINGTDRLMIAAMPKRKAASSLVTGFNRWRNESPGRYCKRFIRLSLSAIISGSSGTSRRSYRRRRTVLFHPRPAWAQAPGSERGGRAL